MFKLIFGKNRLGLGRPLETGRISVRGITGKAGAKTIKKALLTKTGVREVYINREEGVVTVSFDPTLTNIPALNDVILRKGYIADAQDQGRDTAASRTVKIAGQWFERSALPQAGFLPSGKSLDAPDKDLGPALGPKLIALLIET